MYRQGEYIKMEHLFIGWQTRISTWKDFTINYKNKPCRFVIFFGFTDEFSQLSLKKECREFFSCILYLFKGSSSIQVFRSVVSLRENLIVPSPGTFRQGGISVFLSLFFTSFIWKSLETFNWFPTVVPFDRLRIILLAQNTV